MTDLPVATDRRASLVTMLVAVLGIGFLFVALMPLTGAPALLGPKPLWLLSAAAVACLAFAVSASLDRGAFGIVAAALIMGGASQLWLTEPLWFPKLRVRPDGALDILAGLLIALQAVVALHVLWRSGALGRLAYAIRALGIVRLLLIFVLSVLVSLSPMGFAHGGGHWISYAMRLVMNAGIVALNMATLAALLAVPAPRIGFRLPVAPTAALFAVFTCAAMAWYGFDRLPHVEDEAVYMFQANIYAHGALTAPAPPEALRPALDYYLLEVRDGRWIATPPPGWPAILALGVLFGAPWLVNPLLGGLTILVAHALATRLWSRPVANLTVLFLATSPWFIAIGGSLMPHMASLFLVLSTWLLLIKARDKGVLLLALIAGLAMGWVFVIRQLEGVLVGLLTGLWLLSLVRDKGGFARGALYAAGCVIGGAAYLADNFFVTGSPLQAPLARYLNAQWGPGANAYGFGPNIGPPEGWGGLDLALGHTPYEGAMNTAHSFAMLNMEFLGWTIGSLALVWFALLYRRLDRASLAMLGLSLAIIAAMALYWISGAFYIGPRYYFLTVFPLAVLSALGFQAFRERLDAQGLAPGGPAAALAVLCVFGALVFTPWRAVEKYHDFGEATPVLRDAKINGHAVVFADLPEFGPAIFLEDPFLRPDRPIYLRNAGPDANLSLLQDLPGRTVYHVGLGDQ